MKLARRKKWYQRKRFWGGLVLVAAVMLWAWGLSWFLKLVPETPPNANVTTDAIVVLTGGRDRLESGINLLLLQRAKRLFITGVGQDVEDMDFLRPYLPLDYDPSCCIDLGYQAADTFGNAQETALWMQKNNFTSLRLVTAAYHMPRSYLEFHHAMPQVEIVEHPVYLSHVRLAEWWLWPGTAWLVLSEYHKYLTAVAGHYLIDIWFQKSA